MPASQLSYIPRSSTMRKLICLFLSALITFCLSPVVCAASWHMTTFTASGTWTYAGGVTDVNVLLVGGGGGGGTGNYPTGGGGGGCIWYPNLPVSGSLTITIGAGGLGGVSTNGWANGS